MTLLMDNLRLDREQGFHILNNARSEDEKFHHSVEENRINCS